VREAVSRAGQPGNSTPKPYSTIVSACEAYLAEFGDDYRGVGWTKSPDHALWRYRVMVDVITPVEDGAVTLLDFGCGLSHLYEFILAEGIDYVEYSGLDVSEEFLTRSRAKFPHIAYYDVDVLEDDGGLPSFDYIVLNGVFTLKCDLSFEDMLEYFQAVLERVFALARRGIAFNVMSTIVDWERDDLFHLPFDVLTSFVTAKLSRHFAIRHDYRLYEYTTYVYK
jgi:SAM-dependent methyltransferase